MRAFLFSALFLLVFQTCAFTQDQLVYNSKNLHTNDTTWVFKPEKMNVGQKYPVIYLLHGYSGNYKQWHGIMNAQQYANDYGFIVVCPDGLYSSWYVNSPVKTQPQYENFFFDELMPDIKTKYPIDDQKIFISGLSMGGHGALYLFLKKPDLFKSAGSTSGGIKLGIDYSRFGLAKMLGNPDANSPVWDAYSVSSLISGLQGNPKPFIFDCGRDDIFFKANNELKQKCDELKLNATYIAQPGAHNKAYWAKSIKQQFEFFKTLLN